MAPLSIAQLPFAGVGGGIISSLAGGASMRKMVVVVGAMLTVAFAWRYWF